MASTPRRSSPKKSAPPTASGVEPAWLDAGGGYAVTLDNGALVCRNAKGARLGSVPKTVKESAAAEQLGALRDWLADHDRECAATVDAWMLRSLPVPHATLLAVWDDPSWRRPLENAVVVPLDDDGGAQVDRAGFLRGADRARGIGVVDVDGETSWLDAPQLAIPHPILLPHLDGFRELATELDLPQGVAQLHRETWARPADLPPTQTAVAQFAEGKFAALMHAVGRARAQGYRVRGGFATCAVWQGGEVVEARYWIGADAPDVEAYTGDLSWVDRRERTIQLGDVGPVAFSEGMRMANTIWAGRVVDQAVAS